MKVINYEEREDGGADIEVELSHQEKHAILEAGLIAILKANVEEAEAKVTQTSV